MAITSRLQSRDFGGANVKVTSYDALAKSQRRLIDRAEEAMGFGYARYNNLQVGAAIFRKDGKIATGSNYQTPAFRVNHAEMAAVTAANNRGYEIRGALALIGSKPHEILVPCGICRQVIYEAWLRSGEPDLDIIMSSRDKKDVLVSTIKELLPPIRTFPTVSFDSLTPQQKEILQEAEQVLSGKNSFYTPFSVGAAVVSTNGAIRTGSKHTNLTNGDNECAERIAIIKLTDEQDGQGDLLRLGRHLGIVTEGYHNHDAILPCGGCRQLVFDKGRVSGVDVTLLIRFMERYDKVLVIPNNSLIPMAHKFVLEPGN